MPSLPYLEILKKAYTFTRDNPKFWVFGLFLGGVSTLNSSAWNISIARFSKSDLSVFKEAGVGFLNWASQNPPQFILLATALVLICFLLLSITALAYGAVIWRASLLTQKNTKLPENTLSEAIKKSRRFFWRVLKLQLSVTLGFVTLLILVAAPVVYLFSVHAVSRAFMLLLLGLAILLPAMLVFGYLHLYGPIFVVLYDRRSSEAIAHSFNLFRTKLKESLILGAFLLGLALLFIFLEMFSIILFSIPVAIFLWIALKLQFFLAFQIFLGFGIVSALVFVTILNAGFACFQTTTWVLAVSEMVSSLKLESEQKSFAPQPAEPAES